MASSRHYVPNYRRLPAGLLAILAVLAAAVLATGYGYYRHAARQLRLDAESSLHSIADLKANQLARWRMERLGDGLVLQDSPFFSTAAMDLEKNPRNSAVQNALRIRLLETQRAYGYQGCLLLNVKLKVLVSTGHPSSLKNSFLEKLALQTLATGKTHLTDLYLSGSPPRPVMVELIPLFKNPLHRSGQARALAVFTIDPARYLYTILARWPIKTASAESFLAERKEGWVVFLSPLRFKEHAPLQFSLPLSHRGLPAAAAVKGETGVTPGVDYRGVPVFAAIHSIPGTNWLMVAKIDQTEVLAPIRRRAMWTGLFLLLIMGTLGSVAVVGWQWRERRFLRHSLSSQSALAFEREKYQTTFQHAGLGIAQVALDGRWLEVNDQLCRMLGYSRDELLSMTFQDLTHPDDLKRDRSLYQNLRTGNLEKYSVEKRYVTKQRTTFWGNLTVALVRDSEGGPDHFISIIDDITEKKRAEDALKDSELRFKSLFENTMLGLYRTTPAGEILLANPALCGMLGYASFDELKQSNLEAANFHPSYPRDEFKSEIEEKGFVAGLEARWKRKDGRFIWIRESSRAIRDENDCIVYYEGTAEDITERKEAEEAARRKDDLIRMAGEIAKLGGWQFDTATGEGTWTDEVARIHGLNPEDPTSRDIGLQFYRGESKRKIQSALKDVVEKGLPYDLELDLIDAAGREKQVRTQGIPIQEHGKVVQVRGILMDITEQKAAQSRLRLLSEAVEQTHDAVLVTDAKARIVYVNPATETLSGYAANE
ncbi:MAG: PAS domain S-box protein, partial [Acidobacteriota bacterium]